MKLLISKERSRFRFYLLFSLLLLLLFLDYALLISIPSLAYVGVFICAALFGDKDEIISVCICCIPLCTAIDWHYVVIFCCAIFLFKYGKSVKLNWGFLPLVLIVIWEFLHCFFEEANLKSMIAYAFVYLFFIILFFIRDIQMIDYSFIIRNFSGTVFCVCCILTLRLLIHSNFNFDIAFFDMQRLGLADEEIGGLIINPNSLGVQCVIAVGGLTQIRSVGQKKSIDVFLIVLILVLGALTCSRTYLACLLILGIFLLVTSKTNAKGKLKLLLASIFALLIAILLLYLVFPNVLEAFVMRFKEEDITSGRDDIFAVYNNYLFSSVKALFWGLGSLNLVNGVMKLEIVNNVPHNGVQEILVAWGVIGLLLFILMIFVLIRRSRQENPHQSWINYSLFLVLIAKIMVGQVITSIYTMLLFALVYLSLCQDLRSKKIQ